MDPSFDYDSFDTRHTLFKKKKSEHVSLINCEFPLNDDLDAIRTAVGETFKASPKGLKDATEQSIAAWMKRWRKRGFPLRLLLKGDHDNSMSAAIRDRKPKLFNVSLLSITNYVTSTCGRS